MLLLHLHPRAVVVTSFAPSTTTAVAAAAARKVDDDDDDDQPRRRAVRAVVVVSPRRRRTPRAAAVADAKRDAAAEDDMWICWATAKIFGFWQVGKRCPSADAGLSRTAPSTQVLSVVGRLLACSASLVVASWSLPFFGWVAAASPREGGGGRSMAKLR